MATIVSSIELKGIEAIWEVVTMRRTQDSRPPKGIAKITNRIHLQLETIDHHRKHIMKMLNLDMRCILISRICISRTLWSRAH